MQFLWKYVDDLVGKGLSLSVMFELIMYATATFIPLALPLAVLLASLMTFGSLGENYELIALKASGISLAKVMVPIVFLMLGISIMAFFYSNISLPFFNWKMRSLLYDIQQQRPELQIKEGIYYNGIENYSIRIGKTDPTTNLLHDIKIYDHSSNSGNVSVTVADSGYIKVTDDKRSLVIILYSGESYVDMPEQQKAYYKNRSYPFRRDQFKEQIINVSLAGFDFQRTEEGMFRNNFQMMNLKQLVYAVDSMKTDIKNDSRVLYRNIYNTYSYNYRNINSSSIDTNKIKQAKPNMNIWVLFYQLNDQEKLNVIHNALNETRNSKSYVTSEADIKGSKSKKMRKHEIEWHKKFTLSLACLIFFFIGAPLGAIIRKGGLGLPLVISVLFFILYYVISLTGEKMVRESLWESFYGVWLSSLVLLPLGAFLTYKATHDSALLNMDSYYKLLQKIKNLTFWQRFKKSKI